MQILISAILSVVMLFFWGLLKIFELIEFLLGKGPKHYALEPEQNRQLALAHPLAVAYIERGYAELASNESIFGNDIAELRPVALHYFGLPHDMKDELISEKMTEQLKSRWFAMDLDNLRPDDNPRYAMAFACARLTFWVRVATLSGWLDEELQWQILQQNNLRAKDCFSSWQDYALAWGLGRKQWVKHARADSVGVSIEQLSIDHWLQDKKHPWSFLSW